MVHRYIFRMIRCAFCSCFPFTIYNRKSSLPASLLFMVEDDLGNIADMKQLWFYTNGRVAKHFMKEADVVQILRESI